MNDPSILQFLESYEFKVSVLNQLLNDRDSYIKLQPIQILNLVPYLLMNI